jgi:murein DD-endopeptidase MepM/ murein hydrolase activator NlpD
MRPQDWIHQLSFFPVLDHMKELRVLNLEKSENNLESPSFGIGKYNEVRQNMYGSALFAGSRNVHMGIDLSGYVDSPVNSFFDGEIYAFAYHASPDDYGYAVVIKYEIQSTVLYALYGHLGAKSQKLWDNKKKVKRGECIGYLGAPEENGGWPPHLHFQLAWEAPVGADMPGVVSLEYRDDALAQYPDPRLVLGPIYEG